MICVTNWLKGVPKVNSFEASFRDAYFSTLPLRHKYYAWCFSVNDVTVWLCTVSCGVKRLLWFPPRSFSRPQPCTVFLPQLLLCLLLFQGALWLNAGIHVLYWYLLTGMVVCTRTVPIVPKHDASISAASLRCSVVMTSGHYVWCTWRACVLQNSLRVFHNSVFAEIKIPNCVVSNGNHRQLQISFFGFIWLINFLFFFSFFFCVSFAHTYAYKMYLKFIFQWLGLASLIISIVLV